MTDSPWIADVTAETFQADVVDRSQTTPVVVDFWADWCGPCKTLGPLLEKLAVDENGRFFLAKIDVDANPELAQMFQVQGIPMVIAIVGGKPVDAFTGAQSASYLQDFLDRIAPGGSRAESDDRIVVAGEKIDQGDLEGAKELALELRNEGVESPELDALELRIGLTENAGDVDALRKRVEENPHDIAARVELGRALFASGAHEAGLDELLDAVQSDPDFEDGAARKAMLEVFEVLGGESPLVLDFRRRLQMVLF